jgi:hypothetical protein
MVNVQTDSDCDRTRSTIQHGALAIKSRLGKLLSKMNWEAKMGYDDIDKVLSILPTKL